MSLLSLSLSLSFYRLHITMFTHITLVFNGVFINAYFCCAPRYYSLYGKNGMLRKTHQLYSLEIGGSPLHRLLSMYLFMLTARNRCLFKKFIASSWPKWRCVLIAGLFGYLYLRSIGNVAQDKIFLFDYFDNFAINYWLTLFLCEVYVEVSVRRYWRLLIALLSDSAFSMVNYHNLLFWNAKKRFFRFEIYFNCKILQSLNDMILFLIKWGIFEYQLISIIIRYHNLAIKEVIYSISW